MNDEAFLETIRQNPEDDAPRLVYADWLEEQGDIRAEFLRLEVQWAHGKRAQLNAPILKRMEKLRAEIEPNWLAWVERAKRFSVYWSNETCGTLVINGEMGNPLRFVGHALRYREPSRLLEVYRGAYLYPITVFNRRLMVIGRMRVREATTLAAFATARPDQARLLPHAAIQCVLIGEGGTPQRLDRVMPLPAVSRLTFRHNGKERMLNHLRNGELMHSVELQGTFQLTQCTAMDFERLLAGLPFPDLPEEAGLFT
ncbi:MAG TPA: TIGR02996 domain-containing protein [Gemmataceae bacterium]|nr:TIGR02996 domain-containing protein [Gemmataceae bacterium]